MSNSIDNKDFDLLVIGGGPGGYTAAFRAADLGLSVCLVEKHDRLGGVCLNVGCIPSKTLLHGASLLEEAEHASEYGLNFTGVTLDQQGLLAKKELVIGQLTTGLDRLCKARKISRLIGTATFQDQTTLQVETADTSLQVSFSHAVIATGSSPFRLPGLPEDPRIWDSTDALTLKTVPERLLIIGGGIIGLEMAQVYHALGSEITIVEMLPHIIPPADKDIVQPLFLKLKKKYQILCKTRVTDIRLSGDEITAQFDGKRAPDAQSFDAVLVAVGRRPNSEGIGFKNAGIAMDQRGFITVNNRQQTSVDHIYAVGDVAGEPLLAHKAVHEGKIAAENIAGLDAVFAAKTIPSVTYTSPEIAWAGMTEKEAKEKKIAFSKGKFPWGASGRALSTGAAVGVSKVLFEKETGKLLGAGICGAHAGELIHEAVLALEMGATVQDICRTVHAHPTLAETFAFAAEIVNGSVTDMLPAKR
jgi:dihydrolipoamide dehydrogenase